MDETYTPMISEICIMVNNAKDKPKKIAVLKKYRSTALEMFLKSGLDPKIEWLLPEGNVPYIPNDSPEGTEHTRIDHEIRTFHNYVKLNREHLKLKPVIGNPNINKMKREVMFIQLLEGLHKSEAEAVIAAKDKKLNIRYKGLNSANVRSAFNWNEEFEAKKTDIK